MRCAEDIAIAICVSVYAITIRIAVGFHIAVFIRLLLHWVTLCVRPAAAAVPGQDVVAGSVLCGAIIVAIIAIVIITAGGPQGLEGAARGLPVWRCDWVSAPATGDLRRSEQCRAQNELGEKSVHERRTAPAHHRRIGHSTLSRGGPIKLISGVNLVDSARHSSMQMGRCPAMTALPPALSANWAVLACMAL